MKHNQKVQPNMKYSFHIVRLIDHLNLKCSQTGLPYRRRQVVSQRQQTPQGKPVAMPETPLQVIHK